MTRKLLTAREELIICDTYMSDYYSTISSISKYFNISRHCVRNALRDNNIPIRSKSIAQTRRRGIISDRDVSRFMSYVIKKDNGCWEWAGATRAGNGCIYLNGREALS